jgi:hypothetical protein
MEYWINMRNISWNVNVVEWQEWRNVVILGGFIPNFPLFFIHYKCKFIIRDLILYITFDQTTK